MIASPPRSNTESAKILVVDDDPIIRRTMSLCLEAEDHTLFGASSVREALELAGRQFFDVAFVDLRLGGQSGMDLIPELQSANPGIRIILITAFGGIEIAVQAIKRGAFDYLPKPFEPG